MPCLTHHNTRITAECILCSRDICPECVQEFGYYCSEKCKLEAKEKIRPILTPDEKEKLEVMDRKANRLAITLAWVLPSLILSTFVFWVTFKIIDHSGKVRWEIPIDESPSFLKPDHGVLYAIFPSRRVRAYQIKDGKQLWEFQSPGHSHLLNFFEIHNHVGVLADPKNLYGVELETGKPVRHFQSPHRLSKMPLRMGGNLWILNKRPASEELEGSLTAKSLAFQLIKLNMDSFLQEKVTMQGFINPSEMTLVDRKILIIDSESFEKMTVYALDAESGEFLWQRELEKKSDEFIQPIISAHGILSFCSGKLIFLALDGEKVWEHPLHHVPSQIECTSEGNAIVFSGRLLSCYQKSNGKRIWKRIVGAGQETLAIGPKMVYALGSFKTKRKYSPSVKQMFAMIQSPLLAAMASLWADRLYGLSGATGKLRWKKDFLSGKPVFKNGNLYILENKPIMNLLDAGLFESLMRVQCLKGKNGKTRWKYSEQGSFQTIEMTEEHVFFSKEVTSASFGDLLRGNSSPSKISLVCLYN